MAKDKNGKGGGIKNGHLIGQGGKEIKNKGEGFVKEAAKVKKAPGTPFVDKVGPKKSSKTFVEQVRPDQIKKDSVAKPTTPKAKPNPHKKPGAIPTKAVNKPSKPNPNKKPVSAPAKPQQPPKKAPTKAAISKVKSSVKEVAPTKKKAPTKTKNTPTKGR